MATTTKTVIAAGGGDYTTITAAEAASATWLNGTSDVYEILISDNSAYDESVVFNEDGSSTTNYVHLTVASGNRHAGVYTSGKARWAYTGTSSDACYSSSDYFRMSWLQVVRTYADSLDYGIRIFNAEENLLQYLLLFSLDETPNSGSIGAYFYHTSGTSRTVYVDHCMIWGWGYGVRTYGGGTYSRYFDHCHVSYNANGTTNYMANIGEGSGSGTSTYTLYNNVIVDTLDSGAEELTVAPKTSEVLNGSHNCRTASGEILNFSTDNSTNWQDATNGHSDGTPTSGAYVVIEDIDLADFTLMDLRLKDNDYNVALENGTDRQGSEPNSLQDFSVDITGGARGTSNVDIGPHQISVAGTTASAEVATATATAYDTSVSIVAPAETATATATAYDATAQASVAATAEVATATTTANDAAVSIVASGTEAATATATANDAATSITAPAEVATAATTANDAAVSITVTAETATATGTAYDATVDTTGSTTAPAEVATATATAYDASVSLVVGGTEVATVTASGLDAAVSVTATAETATATATAYDTSVSVAVGGTEVATATATANDATVSTEAATTAAAEVATAAATAYDTSVSVVVGGTEVATATTTAYDASVSVTVGGTEVATATTTAYDTTVSLAVGGVEVATATTTANDATVSTVVVPDVHMQVRIGVVEAENNVEIGVVRSENAIGLTIE